MADIGRKALLDKLVEQNIISVDQRTIVEQWSKESDSDDIIIGYVKGVNSNVRPKDIARVVGIDIAAVQAIQKRRQPTGQQFGAIFPSPTGEGWMEDVRKNLADERADKEYRDSVVAAAKSAVEQAFNGGDIDDDQRLALLSKLDKPMSYPKYGELHLNNIFEAIDQIATFEEVAVDIQGDLAAADGLRPRVDVEPYDPGRDFARGPQGDDNVRRGWVGREQQDILAEIPADTWLNAMSQAGFLYVDDDEESDSYGRVIRTPQAERILPDEPLMDPATGRSYTPEMVQLFQDNIIRATTETLDPRTRAIAAAAVREVIDAPYYSDPETGMGRAGRAVRIAGFNPLTGDPLPGRVQMPPEDIGIPTLFADDPFEVPLITYRPGQARFMWDQMSPERRRSWTNDMIRSGTLEDEDIAELDPTDPNGSTQVAILEYAMERSQRDQIGLRQAIVYNGQDDAKYRAKQARADAVAQAFSIPASLREIPGPKTLTQEVKDRFSRVLGREVLDSELASLLPNLQGQYEQSTQQRIALALSAFDGDNQGLLTGAQLQQIEDPGAATSFDIEEKWASEIDLNKRREENSTTFNRMLNATMGGRASIGGQTAAGSVQRIGR